MIELIPAIDLIGGECVRLSQGDYGKKTTYGVTPADMARRYADAGISRLHLVDLDGAKASHPENLHVLEEIARLGLMKIEWGGGIKSDAHLKDVFNAGADYAIIGSVAVKEPDLMSGWLAEYGGERIILGADLRDGNVAVSGWMEHSQLTIDDLIRHFQPAGLKSVICTDISRDGMLQGPNTELYTSLSRRYEDIIFTVSGGISSMSDIETLDSLGLPRVIIGKAIYEGRITLEDLDTFIATHLEF